MRRQSRGPAAVLAAGVLLAAASSPAAAVRDLSPASAGTGDATAAVVACAALLSWLLAGWLLLAAATTAGGHLPGRTGRALCTASRRVAPAAVRRAVELALGLTVVVGSAGVCSAATSPAPPIPPHATSLDWGAVPPAAALAGGRAAAEPARGPAVVVQPGDTLWGLAQQQLAEAAGTRPSTAQVARTWPAWWQANRDVIGDDPDLILPGTRLTPPGLSTTPPGGPA